MVKWLSERAVQRLFLFVNSVLCFVELRMSAQFSHGGCILKLMDSGRKDIGIDYSMDF